MVSFQQNSVILRTMAESYLLEFEYTKTARFQLLSQAAARRRALDQQPAPTPRNPSDKTADL